MENKTMAYESLWRNKWLTAGGEKIGDMIGYILEAADELRTMQAKGVKLDDDGCQVDDYALLVTDDPAVAEEFGFDEEEWDDEDCEYEDDEAATEATTQA